MTRFPLSEFKIELFLLDQICPTEEYSLDHVATIKQEIQINGVWTHPLLIDVDRNALMDGHHRYHAARELGLAVVPVIRMSYNDPLLRLESWRPGVNFTPKLIWDNCETGILLPMKSTRHIIKAKLPQCDISLEELREARSAGALVGAALPHPTRTQILSGDYDAFGHRMQIRTASGDRLDRETIQSMVPHTMLRHALESEPSMAALLPGAPCRVALGKMEDFPFRLKGGDLLMLPPSLLSQPAAMSKACRWGMEAAFTIQRSSYNIVNIDGLLRHGAALLRQLPLQDRFLILRALPGDIAAELAGSSLTKPSQVVRDWMSDLIGVDAKMHPRGSIQALPLELPIEFVLTSNSDSRLIVDPKSGKNRYGTTPYPRPEAAHFSSSTASSISDYGFLYCDALRRDLLNHMADVSKTPKKVRAALSDAIVGEIRELVGVEADETDGVIAPSGTDTEVLAVLLARAAAPELELVNILVSPEETGRGVSLAGAGKYFDSQSATGELIVKGEPIWPGATIQTSEIPIRNIEGDRLSGDEIDRLYLEAGKAALSKGARILAHVLIGSKTGLNGPSIETVQKLAEMNPDRVDVVVDACQMRVDYKTLGTFLRMGWLLQISGSKSLTGPPFSGALMVPISFRNRQGSLCNLMRPGICYHEDWSAWWYKRLGVGNTDPEFGAPLRWLPALLEHKLLRRVPDALKEFALERFRDAVITRLERSNSFRVLSRDQINPAEALSYKFAQNSIVSFEIMAHQWDGRREALGEEPCRKLFELLNSDASQLMPDLSSAQHTILKQEFHIGQPVILGQRKSQRAVLRLVLGVRFFTIVGLAAPGSVTAALESEISDLIRAIDKLELLAGNWWKYCLEI